MRDETGRPQSEMDVLKFYIWLMVVMTLALAAFFWKVWNDLEATKKNLKLGDSWTKTFADDQAAIQGMLKTHKNNKEDVARDQPLTWFSTIWRRCGIDNNSMEPRAWKVPPDHNTKGRYDEESFEIGFNRKMPLAREQIARFCHEIEKSSTRLRIITLDISRVDKENYDKDEWAGKVVVGYRHVPQ